ncbi:MAG: ethanolamine utilization protein EutJ [Mailhella sp.]|nr:ethanolamine utilization protein EutJ [Mailhella sp.]
MDFTEAERKLADLESCIGSPREVTSDEPLYTGVDLGTAYIVVVVTDAEGEPVACELEFAQAVRDGLVVDYSGACAVVRRLIRKIEEKLGRELRTAAIAVPPGTDSRSCDTHRHVVESAGPEVIMCLDEPTAANAVLGITDGAIVDIGGGTTGLSILKDGKVVYTADEPTGGTHLSLVLAGSYSIPIDEAEAIKKDYSRHREIFPVVKPVVEKMASIIRTHIKGHDVSDIYLVGGTCCLTGMENVIAKETGLPVSKPTNPFLVTPLGIALNCAASKR